MFTGETWAHEKFTFLEAKWIGLVEEHGVENEGTILSVLHGSVTRVVFSKEGLRGRRISVVILKLPFI